VRHRRSSGAEYGRGLPRGRDATAHLRSARDRFAALGAAPALERAERELSQLSR
jgi:hypothetical protein